MKAHFRNVDPESDFFIYSPSKFAQEAFLYPIQCGVYTYLPGYSLTRDHFDSFLLMYIQKGELTLTFDEFSRKITPGRFVLIDCYKHHSYSSAKGCQCLWYHFDGITARAYYNNIVSRLGNVIFLPDPQEVIKKMNAILKMFYDGSLVREALLSKYLTDIFTVFLLYTPMNAQTRSNAAIAEEIVIYINEHSAENITINQLAAHAGLSPYHFIRIFKQETGFTPHEYIVNTRITTAKYLLKNTQFSVKNICFTAGFSSESVFCSTFKRHQGITPAQYRSSDE